MANHAKVLDVSEEDLEVLQSRVQARTVSVRDRERARSATKPFDPTACDLLYVLTDDVQRFLIPVGSFTAWTGLTLNGRFRPYALS